MSEIVSLDHVHLSERPLVVCDIDEVVLEFLTPFRNFLLASGRELLPRSFRLHGNIIDLASGIEIADTLVTELLDAFYAQQDEWQTPADQVVETLAALSADADIVFLTKMAPRHSAVRRSLLDRHGLCYPLLASTDHKGPIIRCLHDGRCHRLVFIDDILRNLHSARDHAPGCLLINMMANADFRALAPEPGKGIIKAASWPEAAAIIRRHLAT
ncbi:hypothetical protein [Pararhizobium gei]|uniref:hypothetical protein n=1 Tax=Pararhizobium gei TaxID=1395951 RepID=UPI0023D9E141|nr:hypothetical protein [Rhizobium gei]